MTMKVQDHCYDFGGKGQCQINIMFKACNENSFYHIFLLKFAHTCACYNDFLLCVITFSVNSSYIF